MTRWARFDQELGRRLYPEDTRSLRPQTRAECEGGPRPCPFVSCQHHLYLDVSARNGSIKLNFPDLEVWDMKETCALDVADRGGATLEDVGGILNLTREAVRQIENRALDKPGVKEALGSFVDDERRRPRVHLRVVVDEDLEGVPDEDLDDERLDGDELEQLDDGDPPPAAA